MEFSVSPVSISATGVCSLPPSLLIDGGIPWEHSHPFTFSMFTSSDHVVFPWSADGSRAAPPAPLPAPVGR